MGSGLQNTLVPVRAEIEGFQALVLGGLGAAYYFGFMIGCIAAPLIVQRAGHIRSFVAMVSIGSSVALVHQSLLNLGHGLDCVSSQASASLAFL